METITEFPKFVEGSSEVAQVRCTFERLYKVMRFANLFYFRGQLMLAYDTMHDALALFDKLGNAKAVGIACNNLGCVMLAFYRSNHTVLWSRKRIVDKGCRYFTKSVDLGEDALRMMNDVQGFSENYLVFMQQLSNRYFNRAMFLLTVQRHHPDPTEAHAQGMMDLMTCKDMDREVVDNGDTEGFKGDAEVYFELLLSRIQGLLNLMRMGYEDPWGIDELFDEAHSQLILALDQEERRTVDHLDNDDDDNDHSNRNDRGNQPAAPSSSITLFDDLDPAGQMQRLDYLLIQYHIHLATQAATSDHKRRLSNDCGMNNNNNNNKRSSNNKNVATTTGGDDDNDQETVKNKHIQKAASIAIRMLIEDDFVIADAALLALKAVTDFCVKLGRDRSGPPPEVLSSLIRYQQSLRDAIAASQAHLDDHIVHREWYRAANRSDCSLEVF